MGSMMHGGSGPVALYGPDLSKWPSYYIDAMDTFALERLKVDRAMWDADNPNKTTG